MISKLDKKAKWPISYQGLTLFYSYDHIWRYLRKIWCKNFLICDILAALNVSLVDPNADQEDLRTQLSYTSYFLGHVLDLIEKWTRLTILL